MKNNTQWGVAKLIYNLIYFRLALFRNSSSSYVCTSPIIQVGVADVEIAFRNPLSAMLFYLLRQVSFLQTSVQYEELYVAFTLDISFLVLFFQRLLGYVFPKHFQKNTEICHYLSSMFFLGFEIYHTILL